MKPLAVPGFKRAFIASHAAGLLIDRLGLRLPTN
jgi:hypothetical protein